MKKFVRLYENIALGLFVNSLYSITNGNLSYINMAILVTSIISMGICLYFQKGE